MLRIPNDFINEFASGGDHITNNVGPWVDVGGELDKGVLCGKGEGENFMWSGPFCDTLEKRLSKLRIKCCELLSGPTFTIETNKGSSCATFYFSRPF